jgi:adenylate cyclase
MRIPISVKLIVMTIMMLIGVTVPIALKSSEFFENTSKQREESINLDFAAARATEVENVLSNLFDKTRTTAMILYKMSGQNNVVNQDLEINFGRDKNFISLEVLKVDGSSFLSVSKRVKEEVFRNAGLTSAYLNMIRQRIPFPVANVAQGKLEIINSSLDRGPAMFTIGVPIVSDPITKKITHIAIADINLAMLLKPFEEQKERTFFVTDKNGVLLAHSDEKKAIARFDMKENQIFKIASKAELARGQKPFYDGQEKFFGAFAKTSYGATVFSQISEELILEPAKEVKRRAFHIAGLFLSAALFIVFLFSMTLTSPLETLVGLIGLVSKGNFDVKASSQVKSLFEDEVGQLAHAFDNMTEGLKERDKVKTLFSKFHGSSVTDDLLQGDIGVGGQKKEVVVFFSDIRGFTAFSEKRSPEEVVEMLNEYFAVMVGIINKHHGVVDKFIGDAIMAIWGAPKTTGKDASYAVRACLEMRRGLEGLNEKRIARGQPPINIGMGLHAGSAISGTIGSDERMEYTVIGNTVNTGSRIEASTKAFGSDLLISESVYEQIKDDFEIEYAGAAEVKGRTEALKMYKVRGYKDENGVMVTVKTPYSDYEAESADKVKIAS